VLWELFSRRGVDFQEPAVKLAVWILQVWDLDISMLRKWLDGDEVSISALISMDTATFAMGEPRFISKLDYSSVSCNHHFLRSRMRTLRAKRTIGPIPDDNQVLAEAGTDDMFAAIRDLDQ
jgi:hypothetical protein